MHRPWYKRFPVYCMAFLYIIAGLNHFFHPSFYVSIMPSFFPFPFFLVILSGIAEIFLGTFLIPRPTRQFAALGIILLLIAIFPANIKMMLVFAKRNDPYLWMAILRLPLQFVLIWWAWRYAYKKTLPVNNNVVRNK